MAVNKRKVLSFLIITFTIDWLLAALFFFAGGSWNTIEGTILGVGYMFVPMLSAILVQNFMHQEPVIKPLGISFTLNRWFLLAWLLPPVAALLTLGVSLLLPGVDFSPQMTGFFDRYASILPPEQIELMQEQISTLPVHVFWLTLLQGLITGPTINAIAGFGEELGWRGFLQREFMPLGFWKASLLIGVIWGIWHAPLILQGHNYPQHPAAGVFMMIVWCTLLGPIFSYVRLKARSVIAAAVLHGSLNASAGLPLLVIQGGNDLTVGITGLAGFIVLVIINLLIYFTKNSDSSFFYPSPPA